MRNKCVLGLLLLLMMAVKTNAQTYTHPVVGLQNTYAGTCMVNTCGGTYYDDGGAAGNYSTFIGYPSPGGIYRTFCPSTPGNALRVTFPAFSIEAAGGGPWVGGCYDILQIGNGPTQGSTIIAQGCGTSLQGTTWTSTHPSGCLTFLFYSDNVATGAGWTANFSCVPAAGMPAGTEDSDCINATGICDNGASFSAASNGPGLTSDACTGCTVAENFSNWYEFTIATSGQLGFTLTPTPAGNDYDFALYQATSCGSLGVPVRCSYAEYISGPSTTGMMAGAGDNSEDVTGNGWVNDIAVTAGQHYYLLINEWSPTSGSFVLDWTGTATIATPRPATMVGATDYSNLTYTVCQSAPLTITANGAGGTFTWWNASSGGTNLGSGVNFSPSTATAGTVTYYLQEITPNACTSARTPITITVNPTPSATVPASASYCPGAAVPASNYTSTPAGGSFSWTNSNTSIGLGASGIGNQPAFTATNSTGAAISGTINVTTTVGGCTSPVASYTITVNPNPVATVPSSASYCPGSTVPASNYTSTPAGASFSWTNSNTGIGLGASGIGNTPSFTATNGTGAAISGTITVTPSLGGCTGSPSTYTITVNPTPTVTVPSSSSVCPGTVIATTAFSSTPAGASYSWTNSNTGIGLGASGIGNVPSFTATNATSSPISGTITVTPSLGGCTGTPSTYTITVNPTPTTNSLPSSASYCNGATVPASAMTTTPAGGTFNWTNSNTGIGLGASGTAATNVPSFTATNGTSAPISGTITVTPVVAGCSGSPSNYTITVNPTPTVTVPASFGVCTGTVVPATGFSSTPAGGSFTWTNSNTGIGLAASGITSVPSFTATNGTGSPISGTITVTPTVAGCPGTPATYTITVSPIPTVGSLPASASYCHGASVPASSYTSSPAGGSFSWTNSNSTIGLAASGINNTPVFTATNTGATPVTSTISVTTTVGGCTSAASTYTITVNPIPTLTVPSSTTVCNGTSIPATTFSSSPAGGSFDWTNSNTGIGLGANGIGNIPSFTTTNAGSTVISGTISVTTTVNGCTSAPATYTITVNPTATVTVPSTIVVCNGATVPASTFTSTPAGGSFTWTNSNTGIGLAASGITSVPSFTATNGTGSPISGTITVTPTVSSCVGTPNTYTITVNPTDNASFNYSSATYCQTGTDPIPTITGLTGGTFSSTAGLSLNSTTGTIDLSASTLGTYTITYTTTGACPSSSNISLTITLAPTAGISYAGPYCQSGANPFPTFDPGASAGVFSSTVGLVFVNTNTGEVDLAGSTPGTYNITNSITASGGCAAANDVASITIDGAATVGAGTGSSLCSGTTINLNGTFGGTATSGTWSTGGDGGFDNASLPNAVYTPGAGDISAGTVTLTYTTDDPANSCGAVNDAVTYTINPTPVFTVTSTDPTGCTVNDGTITLDFGVANAGVSYNVSYNDGSGTVSLGIITTNASGTYTITGLPDGTYSNILATLGSCTSIAGGPVTLNDPGAPTPIAGSASHVDPTCGNSDGSITISGLSPSTSYTFTYDNGTGTVSLGTITTDATGSYTITGLPADTYSNFTATISGCTGTDPTSVTLVNTGSPTFTVSSSGPSACGLSDGTITFSGLTPSTNYTVTYNNGATVSLGTITTDASGNYVITGLGAGTYTTFTVDLAGCTTTDNTVVTFTNPAAPTAPVAGTNASYCVGDVIANLTATASSGGTLTWYSDAGLSTVIGTGTSLTPSSTPGTTTYYVTETLGSCESPASTVTITINTIPAVPPGVTASSPYCSDDVPALVATPNSGGTIGWYSDSTLATLLATGVSFTPSSSIGTTTYYVAESNGGCTGAYVAVTITVIDCDTILFVVPTGFTPDGDGTNDVWDIPGLKEKFPENHVEIFTRWGAKIFTSDGYQTPWDGSYNGSKMPLGAYYFVIYFNDEVTDPMKGTVTIIR